MTIARISPVLGVKSVRKSAEYYRDVLGFSLAPVDGVFQPTLDEPDGVYAIVKKGDFWIHFQIRRDGDACRDRPVFERDVYLMVDNIGDEYSALIQRGAKVVQPIHDTPYGLREFTIEDPNGFRLSFGMAL
ncbi:VOC family protein [Pirellulaceae bacterium SH501]